MNQKPLRYRAFVLRMWAEHEPQREVWRFSLMDTQTGERLGFADLERLIHFLIHHMKAANSQAPPEGSRAGNA